MIAKRFVQACVAIGLLALALAGGCTSYGPCSHTYRDALVHVTAVVDSATSAGVDSVFITSVSVNGDSLPLFFVASGGNHESGVALSADTLRCRVPCAFGSSSPGRWQVSLLARGYPLQSVAFEARYGKSHGGCPSYSDNGTSVAFHLSRIRP